MKTASQLFIVMLRQPRSVDDPRTDPFWEFGSFGCTGCHGKNLLHPKKSRIREGDRLAFVQGGKLGLRLLLITSPLAKIIHHHGGGKSGRLELCWDAKRKPFRYAKAPSLFESSGPGNSGLFPRLLESLAKTNRSTVDGKFSSRYRACTAPIAPDDLAVEFMENFEKFRRAAKPSDFIIRYIDALPFCGCPQTLAERKADYRKRTKTLLHRTTECSVKRSCCKR